MTFDLQNVPSLLLVSDSASRLKNLKSIVAPTGLRCVEASLGGNELLREAEPVIALVLDAEPGSIGVRPLLAQARARGVPVVLITSDLSEERVERLCAEGVVDCVPRPPAAASLRAKVRLYAKLARKLKDSQVDEDRGQAEHLLRNLVDNLPELAWSALPDGHIDFYNRRWYEFTGTTFEQMQGWGWKTVHDPSMLDKVTGQWQRSLDTGESFEMEFPLRRADGEFRWFLTRVRALRDGSQKIVRWFGINTDIHEKKELLRQLEAANHAKDEFLATVSHELRTPLTSILGWALILGKATDPSRLQQGLTVIERNAKAQAQLIDDLLDVSRITSGKMRMSLKPVDVATVVDAAVQAVRPSAAAKGLRVVVTLDRDVGQIVADEDRLRQVVWNLLTNSVKFTPNGGEVSVSAARRESELTITVRDTGKGISAAFLPHVFDRFRQDDRSSTTTQQSGLGLGLSIVRHLVELHGGTVRAQSEGPDRGASFEVRLPIVALETGADASQESAAQSPQEWAGRLAGVHVLVVEDEPDTKELVATVLEDAGAKVSQADSVTSAMELLSSEAIHVIVSDIGMPGEDGHLLLRRLRSMGSHHTRDVPALALSAYSREEDREKALASGFRDHVAKPIDPARLVEVVAGLVNRRAR